MSEDLEPVTPDEPQPDQASGQREYEALTARLAAPQNPLLVSSGSAAPSEAVRTRPLAVAFLAAAVAALAGALLWAGIVVATGYNLGILALFIGAATGLTAHRVAGAPVGAFGRCLAGVFAA